MSLRHELDLLAQAAPPPVTSAHVLGLARRARVRRRVAFSSASVVMVALAAVGVILLRPLPQTFQIDLVVVGDSSHLRDAAEALQARADDMGLEDVHVSAGDGSTVHVTSSSTVDGDELRRLVTPGRLQFRKLLGEADGLPGAPVAKDGPASTLEAVKAKLGAEYTAAEQFLASEYITVALPEEYPGFAALSPAEVETLPLEMQFRIPSVSCSQLDRRPHFSSADPNTPLVMCGGPADYRSKLYLAPAQLTGADIAAARARYDDQYDGWRVDLTIRDAAMPRWVAFTTEMFHNDGPNPCGTSATGGSGSCRMAMQIDSVVLSSPSIEATLGKTVQVSVSDRSPQYAKDLAAWLAHPLPAGLSVTVN